MVSNIGQATPDQVTPADIRRYAMDILKMPWSGNGEKFREMSKLASIIRDAPHLAEGLTPFVLDLAMQGAYEGFISMAETAKDYLDPAAIELFAHRHAASTPIEHKDQRISPTDILSDCVHVNPEMGRNLTVYALNFSLKGSPSLLNTILKEAPIHLDFEAVNRFSSDLCNIDQHDPKMQAAAFKTMEMIYAALPDSRNDVSAYEPAAP
jgi:hypothetical protein